MPFITKDRRHMIDKEGMAPYEPGDLCYVYYKEMMEKWRASKRWTTVHEIYNEMAENFDYLSTADQQTAKRLAWEVFFALEVVPYELEKRKENGDV